jgi:hypothetical protein
MSNRLRRLMVVAAVAAGFPLLGAGSASAHWLGYDSVVNNKIDYKDSTIYDDARGWARDRWNAAGDVQISLDTSLLVTTDVEFMDLNAPAASWAGLYDNEAGDDDIVFNSAYMSGYSTGQRRHVALHELGHALGLGHSYTGQIMQEYVGSIQYVQDHDQFSYDYLWG